MIGNGQEAFPKDQEWSGGPPQRAGSDRETLPVGREWSEGFSKGSGVNGNGREALLEGRE